MRRPSGTWTMPPSTIAAAGSPFSRRPSNSRVPSVMAPPHMRSVEETARSSVVLPAPLLPSTATTSPSATDRDTPRSACTTPP